MFIPVLHGEKEAMARDSNTSVMFMRPSRKQIASRMSLGPKPRRLEIASKDGSQPAIVVRTRYHVKPACARVSASEEEEGEGRGHAAEDELLDAQYAAEWSALTECGRAGVKRKGHRRGDARRISSPIVMILILIAFVYTGGAYMLIRLCVRARVLSRLCFACA
jgi:hypothetical protein